MTCPLCGGGPLEPSEAREVLTVPYGPECSFMRNDERCLGCGESGDFSQLNDARIEAALADAIRRSVVTMLEDLSREGLSMAYLERVLRLPQRTLAGWKDGNCPDAGVALLRALRTFPWLARVAESGFDRDVARELCTSALDATYEAREQELLAASRTGLRAVGEELDDVRRQWGIDQRARFRAEAKVRELESALKSRDGSSEAEG